MGTYYAVQGGSRILNATRVDQSGVDDGDVTAWTKANDFIIAINIYSDGKDTAASQYKLRWRDTDGGTFADVASTGAINYSADTDLVNGASIAVGGRRCSTQGDTWQAGEEVEGASLCDSIDLASDYETEIHFALDSSGATDGHTYEFELWNATENAGKGTCGATITMAAASVDKTFTVDSYLVNRLTKEFSINSYLVNRLTKEFSINSYLVERLDKEFSIDGYLVNRLTKEFSIDSILKATEIKEFSIDAILVAVGSKEFSINAILEATQTKEFSVDAILEATEVKEFTVDALLVKTGTKEFSIDGYLVNRFSKDFSINALLKGVQTKEFTVDGYLVGAAVYKTFTIDALLEKTGSKDFSIDGILEATQSKEFSIDVVLVAVKSKDFTVDALLVRTGIKTFTIDASVGIPKEYSIVPSHEFQHTITVLYEQQYYLVIIRDEE